MEIHPKFKKIVGPLKFAISFMNILAIAGLVAIPVMAYYGHASGKPNLKWLWLVFLPLPVVFFSMRFVLRPIWKKAQRASRLLRATRPREMIMTVTKAADMAGRLVMLHKKGATPDSPPWAVVSMHVGNKREKLPEDPTDVRAYVDETKPEFIAVETPETAYWGTITTRESRQKNFRRMSILSMVMIMVMVAMTGTLLMLQQKRLSMLDQDLAYAQASTTWPQAPALIVESYVENVRISKGKSSVPGFAFRVRYEYEVNGNKLEGTRVYYGYKPTRAEKWAKELLKKHPKNKTIAIPYDPAEPRRSTLEPGHEQECLQEIAQLRRATYMILIVSLLTSAILIIFMYIHRRKQQQIITQYNL